MTTQINIKPAVINRDIVLQLLGGISRTTFWRKRKQWGDAGTPFPNKAPGTNPGKGGEQYRYCDVMKFLQSQGLVESTQD